MNMFKPVGATTLREYFDMLSAERREALEFLHKFITTAVPKLKPNFFYNMPGYGRFKYRNYKGEILNWPIIALASQKNYISLYVCAVKDGEYLAEKYKESLGKVNVGRSCIRFKKVEDLNLKVLKAVLIEAERFPGLVEGKKK